MKPQSTVRKPPVLVERRSDRIAIVTLNRPESRNAIDPAVASELDRIVESLESDDDVWAVVLTGAGDKAFCAGADLRAIATGHINSLWTERGGFAGFVLARRTKPWIAAVNGHALAGGLEIALACDMIIADETASLGLPEVTRGLMAVAGGAFRLPRAIPRALALEMITTGRPIDARRALNAGLLNAIAPAGETLQRALDLATCIVANAPLAVRESLNVARLAADLPEHELIAKSNEARDRLSRTEDFLEGPKAFLEKRAAAWKAR
ncbi:enoyl-CoA hydratase-related protein [Paraburkholderia sediminicola]|jgi:enoyl-CoA hydratase/carnithine racemase|uniref:enoyl-CoA hydratase-related protein n=1 Tax=Paraburkholderia sediminicola TaxID=458836 RepID=UPI0038B8064C